MLFRSSRGAATNPPGGRVTLVVPSDTRPEVARAYAASYVPRESHYLWGRRYLLSVLERDVKPSVTLDHRRITLTVRPDSSPSRRERVMHEWHKSLLHDAVPPLVRKWERRLGVSVSAYYLQRMKTKLGSCNHRSPLAAEAWSRE